MLDQKIELLQRVPLFAGLDLVHLEAISQVGQKTYFEAEEKLIVQGEKGDTAYLILTGKAACSRSEIGQIFDEDLWPGTLVGELGMLVETVHALTVTACERLRALAISREALLRVMEENPEIAKHISEKLLERLSRLAEQLRDVDSKLAAIEKAA